MFFWIFNSLFIFSEKRSLHKKRKTDQSVCVEASTLYDSSFFNTTHFPINFTDFTFKDDFQSFAGKGHFSVVKKSFLSDGRTVAVKEFKIFRRKNLIKELSVLKAIESVPNTVKLLGIMGNESSPTVIYSYHTSSKYGYQNITMPQFRWWLKTVLETVFLIHSHGVIHRDLKLGNILANFDTKELAIIDFGLAEFNLKDGHKNPKVGCFRLKAPELAIEANDYDCKTDMWALGIACLDLMIGLRSNWLIKDNNMLVQNLISFFGSENWNRFAKKYDKELMVQFDSHGDIFELAMPGHYDLVTNESLDLVFQFLKFDPHYRMTAKNALRHPFFKEI